MTDPDGTVIRLYSVQQNKIDHIGEPGYARLIGDDTATTASQLS